MRSQELCQAWKKSRVRPREFKLVVARIVLEVVVSGVLDGGGWRAPRWPQLQARYLPAVCLRWDCR